MRYLLTCILALLIISLSTIRVSAIDKKDISTNKKHRHFLNLVMAVNAIKKIEYAFSSSAIRPVYHAQLNGLAKMIIDKNYAIALRGYADSIGNYTANWHLSEKRAAVIKDYLVKRGVTETHIVTTAFGSTKPIATNKTASGRQHNRRVEIELNNI